MAVAIRKKGQARALYLQIIEAAGRDGVAIKDLMQAAGISRPTSFWKAIAAELEAGQIKRLRPNGTRPSRVFMAEHFPGPPPKKPRVYKSASASVKCRDKQGEWLDHIRSLKDTGTLMRELQAHFNVSNQTASQYVQGLAQRGLVSGMVTGAAGKSNREKRWFAIEFAPAFKLPKSEPKKTAGFDPKAPAIIPEGLKITRAQPFVDTRFKFDPPPGWRGCIDSSESREWAKHAQR